LQTRLSEVEFLDIGKGRGFGPGDTQISLVQVAGQGREFLTCGHTHEL